MATGDEVTHGAVNGTDGNQDMVNSDEVTTGAGISGERQPNKERVTTPYLTKYERARILGTRALQIRYIYRSLFFCHVDFMLQHECSCSCATGWRNRRATNCDKRTVATENSLDHPSVSPRR